MKKSKESRYFRHLGLKNSNSLDICENKKGCFTVIHKMYGSLKAIF